MHRATAHTLRSALLSALILCIIAPAGAQNLLRNGNFEGPVAAGIPQGWGFHDFRADDLAQGEIVDRNAKIGRQALMLEAPVFPADFAAFTRPIDVSRLDTNEIIFSCFFRTEDHPQALVTLATYGEDFTVREFRTPELQSESHPLGESSDWLLYTTHLSLPQGAEHLVVMLRILGGGKVWWDGVSVRPVGTEIEATLDAAGTITRLPNERTVRVRVGNVTGREQPLRLEVEALSEERQRRSATEITLAPGQSRSLELTYDCDYRTEHDLTILLRGDRQEVIYEAWERRTPGLVDARIIRPAFRQSVMSTLPGDSIVVEGRINARPEIARTARVTASLVGMGERTASPQALTDRGMAGPWRVELSSRGMLTQRYQVDVTALVDDREHTLSLPLVRVRPADAETAYDAQNRLWVNGDLVFPLGIYRVVREEDLPTVAEAGFNFVITPSRLISFRYVNAARDAGAHVVLASNTLDGQFWDHITRKFFNHQAMLGWYGIELPDTRAVTRTTLWEAYRRAETGPHPAIAEADPHRPILLSLRPNYSMPQFAELADIVLAWSDPVPRWPITTVADAVHAAREAVADRKPVWAIIQSSGRRWTNELGPTLEPDARPPTPAEHRAMVYLALMAGADGLVYHAFSLPSHADRPAYSIRRDEPQLWDTILETNQQLRWLAPVLLHSKPEPIEFEEDSPIRAAAWEHQGARYVIAVNTEDSTSVLAFDVGASAGEEIPVLFERRTVVASPSGDLGDVFEPFGVHIYQVGP